MEQTHVYAPQATGPSAPPPPQSGGPAGVIVDPRFCAPYPVDMIMVRKLRTIVTMTDDKFIIKDVEGNLMFRVKQPVFGLHKKRILFDCSRTPVLTMRHEIYSLHDRWQVFKGGSTDQRDLLYTVKRSSMYQFSTKKLDVFLGHNYNEDKICDFRVKGSKNERSCIVYAGESDAIVAQMHKKNTVQSVLWGMDDFLVTVYPNVDHAFIASLIVILDDV